MASKQFAHGEYLLSAPQTAVLTRLRDEDYATIPLAELPGQRAYAVLPGVKQVVDNFIASEFVRDEVRHYQENYKQLTGKDYVVRHYQKKKERSLDNPIFRLGLDPAILEIVNSYAKMNMRFQGNDIWYTNPVVRRTAAYDVAKLASRLRRRTALTPSLTLRGCDFFESAWHLNRLAL